MSSKRSTTDSRWGRYLMAGALLLAVLVASGISAQLSASSDATQSSSMEDADPTLYAYGDRRRPLVEETGGAQTLNIYGPGGQIIAQVAPTGQGGQAVRHLLADHLGSTQAARDGGGNVVAHFEYGPHGETAVAAGAAAAEARYRYTGHPWDEAQGLYQTPARGYDPTTGRFLSVDPQRQDASPYVYAANNPVGYVDPTGGGVKTPFFMETNMDKFKGKASLPALFEAPPDLQMVSSDSFHSPDGSYTGSTAGHGARKRIVEGSGKLTYERTSESYWFIGGDGLRELPNTYIDVTKNWRKKTPTLMERTVIIDLSGTRSGEVIRDQLRDNDRNAIAITVDKFEYGLNSQVSYMVDKFVVGGREYGRRQFIEYVYDQMKAEWGDDFQRPQITEGSVLGKRTSSQRLGPDLLGGASPRPPTTTTGTATQLSQYEMEAVSVLAGWESRTGSPHEPVVPTSLPE